MGTIGIVIGALLAVAAAISTIGGAWKYIQQMKQPYEDLKNKVIKLEEQNKASMMPPLPHHNVWKGSFRFFRFAFFHKKPYKHQSIFDNHQK